MAESIKKIDTNSAAQAYVGRMLTDWEDLVIETSVTYLQKPLKKRHQRIFKVQMLAEMKKWEREIEYF